MDAYFYYTICFLIFCVLFYKPIYKLLISFLDNKISEIKWDIESAINSKDEAYKELTELKNDMTFVEKKHKQMLDEAEEEIKKSYNQRKKEFEKFLSYLEKNNEQKILQMEAQAILHVKKKMLDESLSLVSKYCADQKNFDLAIIK